MDDSCLEQVFPATLWAPQLASRKPKVLSIHHQCKLTTMETIGPHRAYTSKGICKWFKILQLSIASTENQDKRVQHLIS